MQLSTALARFDLIVQAGPIKTRLEFEHGIKAPAYTLLGTDQEKILHDLFSEDIIAASKAGIPIIIPSPTYLAGMNRILSRFSFKKTNELCLKFTIDLANEFQSIHYPVITTACLAPMFNGYNADRVPSVKEAAAYHDQQIKIFNDSDIDLISGITLSTKDEALGIALTAENYTKDYLLCFVLSVDGLLLDGSRLEEVIYEIENAITIKKPLGYLVYCTHTSVLDALNQNKFDSESLLGIVANASSLSPSQLDGVDKVYADDPIVFANDMIYAKQKFNFRILGSCCGTSTMHLSEILKRLK